jgi:hypothetical protein
VSGQLKSKEQPKVIQSGQQQIGGKLNTSGKWQKMARSSLAAKLVKNNRGKEKEKEGKANSQVFFSA